MLLRLIDFLLLRKWPRLTEYFLEDDQSDGQEGEAIR